MKKILSLVVALGVATLFSSAALAGADCSPTHKTQAAVDRTEAQDVATAPLSEKAEPGKVQTAQANPAPTKPASTTKK